MKKRELFFVMSILFLLPVLVTGLILFSESAYNSTDTNITQESNFSHLNISDPNLILYLPFDIQERIVLNKTYDYTNNSNDGTLGSTAGTQPTWISSGYVGGAYTFDGVNDFINIGTDLFESDDVGTISIWIKVNEDGNFNTAFSSSDVTSNANQLLLGTTDSGGKQKPMFQFYNDSGWNRVLYIETNLSSGQWAHLVFTSNGTWWKGYIDGTEYALSGTNEGHWFDDLGAGTHSIEIGRVERLSANSWKFNGSIDEVMIFNRTLNATEVANIYNNQSSRFFPLGNMLFQNNNFSVNNTVNITLNSCGTEKDSRLRAKINSGSWENFSSCLITDYYFSGNLTHANLTIGFVAGNESNETYFYSPFIEGDITLTSWENITSNVIINSPTAITYTTASVLFNITATDNSIISSCWYSIDSGTTNQTLTNDGSTDFYNYTNSSVPNANYVALFWCNDSSGNLNNTESVLFTVAVPTEETTITIQKGGDLVIYSPSFEQLKEGYLRLMVAKQKVKVTINDQEKTIEIKSVDSENDEVNFSIDEENYTVGLKNSTKIDTNSDGYYDLEVSVFKVQVNGYAELEFKEIYEEVPKEIEEEKSEEVVEEGKDNFVKKVGLFFKGVWDWVVFWK
jgi:Concanavalin A-like lectin/glucanases superfamily